MDQINTRTEGELLNERRQAAGLAQDVPTQGGKPRYRALSFSGGGIRSATFSLGVLEAIARDRNPTAENLSKPGDVFRASRLSTFDYLSTVSGGGYLGGFLCSLFQPNRLRDQNGEATKAADDAVRVLTSGPPGRIHSNGPFDGDQVLAAPLAWLRENGRYLMPTGAGDAFYAAALGIRNWLALHYVIGTVLIMLLALVGALRAFAAFYVPKAQQWEVEALNAVIPGGAVVDHIWWSPLFPVALAPVALVGIPLGIAFWLVNERRNGKSWPINLAVLFCVPVAAALILFGQRQPLIQAGGVAVVAAIGIYILLALFVSSAAVQRVHLTRWLATVLVATACIVGLAVVDTLGQTLYFLATMGKETSAVPALTPAGVVAALVWLSRHFAAKDSDGGLPTWLQKLPLMTLAGLGGVLIFTLVGGLWSMFVQWIVWDGKAPDVSTLHDAAQRTTLLYTAGVGLLLAAVTGLFPGFINLSSLQAFYSSRLTRAYLGASNGTRFQPGGSALSAAEPLPNDNLAMENYFAAKPDDPKGGKLTTLAPLHIINITVNKTVDPAEQLVQRDRKGQPMAVLPSGFSIDGQWRDGYPNPKLPTEVNRPMSIGRWIGTSGAAFSTGIGRETSLGMSLLMGSANVRLGTWWESGMGVTNTRGLFDLLRRAIGAVFRTQSYISYELRARFFGTHRQWQYLSDGGHFENTGIYELLRKDRRVFQVFGCDNGADPLYRFEDLANLIRLARIDLNVDIEVQTEFTGALAEVFAGPEAFARMSKRPDPGMPSPATAPCAMLLWARQLGDKEPSTQIILLKPNVAWDAAADVRQYALEHPAFPQEPTADQFFDEAQWESYRALGYHLGRKVFNARIMAELDRLAHDRIPGDRPAPPVLARA
ncbi:patatin-like phospholipase family protein [Aquabacterium sp.]|uniref:patatin-like phospholipase family protein n=1 Tax=Aquabacterium sp. TaxID=1872578 RepID=UPI003D6C751A